MANELNAVNPNHGSRREVESEPEGALDQVLRSIREVPAGLRRKAVGMFNRSADQLAQIADSPEKVERLIASTGRIGNHRERTFYLECLGFDYPTSVGLGLRVANGWKVFQDGRAVLHKRPPLSMVEARATLKKTAQKLRELGELATGLPPLRPHPGASVAASAGWDGVSKLSGMSAVQSTAGSIALIGCSELANENTVEYEKLMALTPARSREDIVQALAEYNKNFAINRISFVLSPVRYLGTAVGLAGALAGKPQMAPGDQPALHQLLADAAAN